MKGNTFLFLTAKRNMLIGRTLLLAMMSLLTSSKEEQSLTCYHDYIEIFTCEWNTSALESGPRITTDTNCFLRSSCEIYEEKHNVQSDLVPIKSTQPELLKATLRFKNECLMDGSPRIPVDVLCGDEVVAGISKFDLIENIKLHPPGKPQVNKGDVSWTLGSPHSSKIEEYKFQIQYKLLEQNWEEKPPTNVESLNCSLKHVLTFGKQYEVRVRSQQKYSAFWSDWSPSTRWTSTVGKRLSDPNKPWWFPSVTGTAVVVTVAVILLIFFRCHPVKYSLKPPDIRNPFEDFYSIHGGDIKSWLGPLVAPETLVKANTEYISPLELCKAQDCGGKDKTKSFSNSTYFLSQSSKCAVMEPCLEQSPYGPAGDSNIEEKVLLSDVSHSSEESISGPLETSSSYKHLQKLRLDVQSPDSGFAAGSDQESQEESSSEGLPSPPVIDNIPISNILPCPSPQLPHVAGFPHLLFLSSPGFGWSPQTKHPLELLQSSIPINTLMGNPDIMAFSSLEPANEDYMPLKKVQE